LLLQLQQFKAASLARFPTATQKRALPRVGDPLRAGLFLKWLSGRQISAPSPTVSETPLARTARLCRTGKTFIRCRQQSLTIHLPCSAAPEVQSPP
jgi:hypothetical protein